MPLAHSWDPESKEEFRLWIRHEATLEQKETVGRLWAIMDEDILETGPDGMSDSGMLADRQPARRHDGTEVTVYAVVFCLPTSDDIGMYFGYANDHIRLVSIGPCNPSSTWAIALERINRWGE